MDATLDVRIGRVLGPQIVTTTVAIANTVRQRVGTGGPLPILAMVVGRKSKESEAKGLKLGVLPYDHEGKCPFHFPDKNKSY